MPASPTKSCQFITMSALTHIIGFEREHPEVRQLLSEENAATKNHLAHTESLQKTLFDEIKGRIKQDDSSVPCRYRGMLYYQRFEAQGEYPIYCRKPDRPTAQEEILLDVNELGRDHEYCDISCCSVSPNGRFLVFAADYVGRRIYTLHFKDLETGEILTEKIENTDGHAEWSEDSLRLYYTIQDEELRPYKVFVHEFQKSQIPDREIFHESDAGFHIGLSKTKSRQFILIGSYSTLSTEYHTILSTDPHSTTRVFSKRQKGLEYYLDHSGKIFSFELISRPRIFL